MLRRLTPLALLLLATLACLEPPVTESLDIDMLGRGASRVSVSVALRDPADYDRMPKARQRLLRRDRLRGSGRGVADT